MGILAVYRSDADLSQVEGVLSDVFDACVGSSLEKGRANLFVNVRIENGNAVLQNGSETVFRSLQEVRNALAVIGVTQMEY